MTLPLARPIGDAASRLANEAGHYARRSIGALRDGSWQLRDGALRASDRTVWYIKDEPVKAVCVAAIAGAALMYLAITVRRARPADAAAS
jgi:hypothetical protein